MGEKGREKRQGRGQEARWSELSSLAVSEICVYCDCSLECNDSEH